MIEGNGEAIMPGRIRVNADGVLEVQNGRGDWMPVPERSEVLAPVSNRHDRRKAATQHKAKRSRSRWGRS